MQKRIPRAAHVLLVVDDSDDSRKAEAHLKERQIDFALIRPSKGYNGPGGPYPLLLVHGTDWRGLRMIVRATSMDPRL